MKLKEGMVVHCDTEEKSYKFLEECVKHGIWTCHGDLATKLSELGVWHQFEKETCYIVEKSYSNRFSEVYFDSKEYYIEGGYQITEFDDLFKSSKKENKEHKIYKIPEMPSYVHDNVTKVIISNPCVIVFLNGEKKGLARCHEEDVFDEELGYEIAYKRATIKQMKMNLMTEEYLLQRLCR